MTIILQIVFLIIPLLFVGFGVLIGRKLKWQFSLAKIVVIAVSAIISALVAAATASAMSHIVAEMLIEGGVLGEYVDLVTEVESVKETACAFAAMIIAPIIYLPIFLILRGILGLVNRLLLSKFYLRKEDGEKSRVRTSRKNPWGLVIGALCGLFLCSAVTLPAVETLTVVGSMPHVVAANIGDEEMSDTIEAIADAEEINVSSVIVNLTGGRLVYKAMTTYDVMGTKVSLFEEAEFLEAIEGAFITAVDESFSNEERADTIREISNGFDKSEAFPMIVVDVVAAAQKDWDEGKEFCGIESPSFGEAHRSITDIFVDCIKRSSYDTVKEDVGDVAEVLAIVIENDCWDDIQEDPVRFIENENVTAKILLICVENERMYPAIDDIADFGVDELFDSFGAYENKAEAYAAMLADIEAVSTDRSSADIKAQMSLVIKNYGLQVNKSVWDDTDFTDMDKAALLEWVGKYVASSEADFAEKTTLVTPDQITYDEPALTDPVKESNALAHVLSTAVDLVDNMQDDEMSASELLSGLGPVLDALVETETFGEEKTELLLKGILQSEKIYGEIGFTMHEATLIADKIIEGAETIGFSPMMLSLGQMVEVISNATTTSKIGDSVNILLESITPEAAEVIAAVATPDTMKNYGISEDSASVASKLIADMFSKLSGAKDSMDEESFNKESNAVTDVVNIMMSSGILDADGTFGKEGKMGVDAEQYIDDIISSDVVSDAIIDTVYGEEDTATLDPFGVGIELTESEMAQLESIINDKWINASEEEKTEGNLDKLLISIGAIVNADISIVDGNIVVNK